MLPFDYRHIPHTLFVNIVLLRRVIIVFHHHNHCL